MLSESQIAKREKLTPKEQAAVDAFVSAAKALPRTLCVHLEDYGDRDDGLSVSKRITKGSCRVVANIRKRSLIF